MPTDRPARREPPDDRENESEFREQLSWDVLTPPGITELTVLEGRQPAGFRDDDQAPARLLTMMIPGAM